jgi:hypothetical protein
VLTSFDGGVTLRVDAHEGCTTGPTCSATSGDTIGFTVLSGKDSALFAADEIGSIVARLEATDLDLDQRGS